MKWFSASILSFVLCFGSFSVNAAAENEEETPETEETALIEETMEVSETAEPTETPAETSDDSENADEESKEEIGEAVTETTETAEPVLQETPGEPESAASEETITESGTETTEGTVLTEPESAEQEEPAESEEEIVPEEELAEADGLAIEPADSPTLYGFVTRMYEVVLDREPETGGYAYWTQSLYTKEKTAADIVHGFFFSSEYQNKKKSNEDVVKDYYKAMLNREPDTEGFKHWTDRMNAYMTMDAIAYGFVGSNEFKGLCEKYKIDPGTVELTNVRDSNYERTYFAYRLYKTCLQRDPDIPGLEDWCTRLKNQESGAAIAAGFVFSEEYKNKHEDNEAYVSMLYRTILGREGEPDGMNNWITALNYTNTREMVFNGFLFSPEFANLCKTAEINVGDKIATKDDTAEWKMNIEILNLCNQQRKNNGLSDLHTRSDLWEDVAVVRAKELPSKFSHTRPDGTSWISQYAAKHYNYHRAAENIAGGYPNAQAVVNGWMNSPGHRANILDPNLIYLTTGYYVDSNTAWRYYYCQNFLS